MRSTERRSNLTGGPISREWLWRFPGHPPEAIWASLAHTARFNEAAALPKHEVEEIAQADGLVGYFGRGRGGPSRLVWREQPVNWVHAQWFEHCRHFVGGPLRSLCAELTLTATGDGCEGRYRISAEPRGVLGQVMLRSGVFLRRAGARFTRLADDAREFASGARETPFHVPPPRLPAGARGRAAAMMRQIEATPHVAPMSTDLKGSTALYEAIGSARAYRLVRDHFALLTAVVRAHDGGVVKTIGDAVMASFVDPVDAVAAALAIQAEVARFNARGDGQAITIKLGVHAGPCIAVTLNDRLDYFGSTVNMAARLQSESLGGDVVLSAEIVADLRVRDLLRDQALREQSAELKGFAERVVFFRLVPAGPPPAAAQKIPAIARVRPAPSSGAASS